MSDPSADESNDPIPGRPGPRPVIPLDYHLPTRKPVMEWELPPRFHEATGGVAVVLGLLLLLATTFSPGSSPAVVPDGLALVFGGAGWWTVHRAQRRGRPGLIWAVQVLLACAVVAAGMFRVARLISSASPGGWAYWLTENQTYRYTRSKMLPYLWLPGIGVAWLLLLGIVWGVRRLARTHRPRNNPPPEQE